MKARELFIISVGCVFGIVPLWMGVHLPMVDVPQHLHLISVLHRLDDTTTLYPQWFEARGELTPYVGYYYLVSGLNWLVPIEMANKLFLSAYVTGFVVSVAFLLRSLKKQTWPALLTVPFAYGDSFGWGFVNYLSAIPLAICACALLVRCIEDVGRRQRWGLWLAVTSVATLLFHVQMFAFIGVALPFLWLVARTPEEESYFRARKTSLKALMPSVGLFSFWVLGRLGKPTEVEEGAPWKAWGPLWSEKNWAFKPLQQNVDELFSMPANLLRDKTDEWGFYAALGIAALALLARLLTRPAQTSVGVRTWPLAGLAVLALALYLFMPFDIRGYMYYLNTRYVHLFWPLFLACVPELNDGWKKRFSALALMPAALTGIALSIGIGRFNEEASALNVLARSVSEKPSIMGLIYNPMSSVVTHPVYLHAPSVLARLKGGLTHFSFATTPHSPVKFKVGAPPTYPSEWRPQQFNEATMGEAYDYFLVRGANPSALFSPSFSNGLRVVSRAQGFVLLEKKK